MFSETYEIFADYHQFYLQDETADGDLSEAWTDATVANMLAVVEGAVGVGTVRNMRVTVNVEVFSREPSLESSEWDLVNECSISVQSGRLVIAGCTDYFPSAKRIEVPSGTYRVRVCYGNLNSVSADGLEGSDHYRLQLWPGSAIRPTIVKALTPN